MISSTAVNQNFANLNNKGTFTGSVVGNATTASTTPSVQTGGVHGGMVADSTGLCTFQTKLPVDWNGNTLCPAVKSSGNGGVAGVTVSHGYAGGVTPNAILLSPVFNGGVSWAVNAVGSTTYTAWLSVTVSFSALAVNPFAFS